MDEAHFEHAERLAEAERMAAADAAHQALSGPGAAECEDCGCVIPAERRASLPSAVRCVHCQTAFERMRTRYAHPAPALSHRLP